MDKNELKNMFENEIAKTKQLIVEYRELTKPVAPDVAIGRISRMDAINNKSVVESLLRQAEDKLNKLIYLLSKIDSAEFGLCIKCKNPIPIKRMLIKPESLFCVNCAK